MTQLEYEAVTSDGLRKMTPEELHTWIEWEPELTPLKSFPLCTGEGRRAFLWEFYLVGWDSLFQAVTHVWESLAEPQEVRCTLMGVAAGTGGTGKLALVKVLSQFLEDALSSIEPIPPRSDYDSLDAWHKASMATWQTDEARVGLLQKTYANILDGRIAPGSAVLLSGPWRQRAAVIGARPARADNPNRNSEIATSSHPCAQTSNPISHL